MQMQTEYTHSLSVEGAELFTMVFLPSVKGTFPTVILRIPYVDDEENLTDAEIFEQKRQVAAPWLKAGYAVVRQHCRGCGRSTGDCIPYIYEREDGLALQDWIRRQPFYNGELYLTGGSYLSSVHFATAPFAPDIKGAVLQIQDCERYNINYRNGFYKVGLNGGWYVRMYKKKTLRQKNYSDESHRTLPLCDFSKRVFGESAEALDELLKHPDRNDPFWDTRFGGADARHAIRHANIPILLVTGFYDIYTGGILDMWQDLDEATRAKSALVVHPFDHNGIGTGQPVCFSGGCLNETMPDFPVRWMEFVRGKAEPPFQCGKVTYYKVFGEQWCCDDFFDAETTQRLPFGQGEKSYTYDPADPARFKGGLSANFGGCAWQDPPNSRQDILSFYTPVFEQDTYIKGRMRAKLRVKSSCEDTCFYMRLSLCKPEGDYGLRDDIQQISNFTSTYQAGQKVEIEFTFDPHAFLVQKGERIRVDVSSSAYPHYTVHTNQKGLFSAQTTTKIAENTVCLDDAYLEIPIKSEEN